MWKYSFTDTRWQFVNEFDAWGYPKALKSLAAQEIQVDINII